MTRIAFICLGAYHINNWSKEQNFNRQSVYSIALSQALSLARHKDTLEKNLSCEFFIVENTVSDESQIIDELKQQFTDPLIQDVQYINNNNLGSKNKGAGEYMMCRAVLDKHKERLNEYDWVIYYTLRQIIVAPLVHNAIHQIENMESGEKPNTIVGNPVYVYANEKQIFSAPGNYCDMIFAMKPTQFFSYIESMSPEELASKKMSSEQNLFNFIKDGEQKGLIISTELEHLGVMRYNYAIHKTELV